MEVSDSNDIAPITSHQLPAKFNQDSNIYYIHVLLCSLQVHRKVEEFNLLMSHLKVQD